MRPLRSLTGTKDEVWADPVEPAAAKIDAWEAKIENMMNITSVRRMIYVGMKKGSLMIFWKEQPRRNECLWGLCLSVCVCVCVFACVLN